MAQTLFYRIMQAVNKIGTNGTSIPNGTYPKDKPKNNEATDKWHNAHKIVCEYLYASTAAKNAEARTKKAKAAMDILYADRLIDMKPGDQELHDYDNVGVTIKKANGRVQLDKELLITNLAQKAWQLADINKFIEECSSKTKDPVSYIPSTTVE